MKQRVITGFFFTLGVLAFVVPAYWFPLIMTLFAVIVGGVAFYEMIKALKAGDMEPSVPLMVSGGVLSIVLFALSYLMDISLWASLCLYSVVALIFAMACVIIPSIFRKEGNHLHDGLITAASFLYITFPMFCLCAVAAIPEHGWFYMVPALASAWVSDVFAYFTGVTLGKHKIVPHISPKKTWEGCIGGAVCCAATIAVYFDIVIYDMVGITINKYLFTVFAFALGFMISVMSQLGDWLASLVKRRVGIKDYGNIFPGHGGMLDRFDSVFFTVPTGVLLALAAIYFTK